MPKLTHTAKMANQVFCTQILPVGKRN